MNTDLFDDSLRSPEVLPPVKRMRRFHHDRILQITTGELRLHGSSCNDFLLVHFLPEDVFSNEAGVADIRIEPARLKEVGELIPPLGGRGGYSRFNVDGFLNHDGHEIVDAYTLLFRDGRAESLMPSIRIPMDRTSDGSGPCAVRDSCIEQGVLKTTKAYLAGLEQLDLNGPVWLFSCIVNCKDVHICTDWGFRGLSRNAMDRSPCFLPQLRFEQPVAEVEAVIRPWCDLLWQAFGFERSFNFDENGNWRTRRR